MLLLNEDTDSALQYSLEAQKIFDEIDFPDNRGYDISTLGIVIQAVLSRFSTVFLCPASVLGPCGPKWAHVGPWGPHGAPRGPPGSFPYYSPIPLPGQ